MEFISRFFDPPDDSYYLFGPRGTGKTVWCLRHYSDCYRIDLLQPAMLRRYRAHPERILETVRSQPSGRTVIIDEVQRVPELLSAVHKLIEEKRGWKFVLTGSSARKLKRSGIDLMAGRAVGRTMHPFLAAEIGDSFDIDTALQLGMLPIVLDAGNPADVLDSYSEIYVREEIQSEGLVRNLDSFSRFLESISFSHGQILNVSNVARECEVGSKSVEAYITILEDLLLAFRLPVFMKRVGRATVRHKKFYFFDAGVFRSLRPAGPLDRREEISGPALEGLVAQHLRAWIAYGRSRINLYYWRSRGGSEVDFVLYGDDVFCGIEVKSASRVFRADLRGLKGFRDDYPEARAILLYRGNERLFIDDVMCLPCGEFLRSLIPNDDAPFRG